MTAKLNLNGKVAVITGAASGIGRALACSLAGRGCHVALADIDEAGLEETALLLGNAVAVSRHRLDVSDRQAITAFPQAVIERHGHVDVLVNNAGVALMGTFEQVDEADFDWLLAINFHGVVRLTRAFLPHLKARPAAQLVNLSSLFGLIAPSGQAAYSASKFAVRGFSEALRHELAAQNSTLGVTVVHPGGVKTSIAINARPAAAIDPGQQAKMQKRFARGLTMTPERAAEIIASAIERRRPRVLVGADAKLLSVAERLMPVNYWGLISRLLK
jgi:NADP-dependent 3-hydroxy acid dehydrogenase YdfG